jgi:hypothetical protein
VGNREYWSVVGDWRYLVAWISKLEGIVDSIFLLHVLEKMIGVPDWSLSVPLCEFNSDRVLGFLSLQESGAWP